MKKILMSVMVVALVSVVGYGATQAYFSDTETSEDNSFTSGVLDLQVEGEDSIVPFTVTNIVPGETKGSTTYMMQNVGTVPGVVTMKVTNVRTEENTVHEPEESAGDGSGVRLDPDNFSIATGDGELLDQVVMRFWVDDTPGQRPAPFDWQDKYWEGYPDESSYYSLPVDTDLMASKNIVMQPGDVLYFGVVTKFISDTNTPYDWILDGVANNTAMDDSIIFDLEMGLQQVTP